MAVAAGVLSGAAIFDATGYHKLPETGGRMVFRSAHLWIAICIKATSAHLYPPCPGPHGGPSSGRDYPLHSTRLDGPSSGTAYPFHSANWHGQSIFQLWFLHPDRPTGTTYHPTTFRRWTTSCHHPTTGPGHGVPASGSDCAIRSASPRRTTNSHKLRVSTRQPARLRVPRILNVEPPERPPARHCRPSHYSAFQT